MLQSLWSQFVYRRRVRRAIFVQLTRILCFPVPDTPAGESCARRRHLHRRTLYTEGASCNPFPYWDGKVKCCGRNGDANLSNSFPLKIRIRPVAVYMRATSSCVSLYTLGFFSNNARSSPYGCRPIGSHNRGARPNLRPIQIFFPVLSEQRANVCRTDATRIRPRI